MGMVILSLVFALCTLTHLGCAANSEKKLIEYGWDCPTTAFFKQNVKKMEKLPFDGVVIQVAHPEGGWSLGWRVFSKVKFRPSEYAHAIKDLANIKSSKLTDNFIQVIAMPGDVDWFDPEWSAVAYNAACLAKVAKLGGCKGIMFDPEMYGEHQIWSYKAQPAEAKAVHTYGDYVAMVKERGKEFIRAINKEFPDITILALFGPALPYEQSVACGGIENADYSLLAAFYDGICEAATPGTILIDGYEQSYGFIGQKPFEQGRRTILEGAKTISTAPKAFTKHVRVGFGIWADYSSGKLGWHPEDFTKNYFSPSALRASTHFALKFSDGYVWIYSERLRWWDFNVPSEYIEALALAKTGPGAGNWQSCQLSAGVPHAAEQPGYSDEQTFAEFRKTLEEVYDLPKDGWRFSRDESNFGEKQGWAQPTFDDSEWRTISIGKFWEEQGESYDGFSWYRLKFIAPKIETGKQVFLVFGAVDESAWVWLNGNFVGKHDLGGIGWLIPFKLDITKALKPGGNVLAVKVLDTAGAGGIWKSVKLMTK
ncbi:MAG: beta galactosidase jelly roll domain-containing protein [Armatimonadetes bacterium]|nr:beta galactosidase jelly roll domain-containing protein [Armatimonadota bacterium]